MVWPICNFKKQGFIRLTTHYCFLDPRLSVKFTLYTVHNILEKHASVVYIVCYHHFVEPFQISEVRQYNAQYVAED